MTVRFQFKGSETHGVLHGLSHKGDIHSGMEEMAKDSNRVDTHILTAVGRPW